MQAFHRFFSKKSNFIEILQDDAKRKPTKDTETHANNATTAFNMYYTIAVLAQQSGDNAKACGYYQKLTGNAKYGETAKQQITALKCN